MKTVVQKFIGPGILILMLYACGRGGDAIQTYEAQVIRAVGTHLLLNNLNVVKMVGVYVPSPDEPNHHEGAYEHLMASLIGRKVTLRTVEKKHKDGYPYEDLVEVFVDGENLNRQLLESGMAFFSEDHWNKNEKESYRQLEEEAKSIGVGIWANAENLKELYVRPRNGRFVHFPGCPHVKDLSPEDRVIYYVPLPRTPLMAVRLAYFCDYCRPLIDRQMQEIAMVKAKLERHVR